MRYSNSNYFTLLFLRLKDIALFNVLPVILLAFICFTSFSQPKLTSLNPNRIYTQNASQEKGFGPIPLKLEIIGENIFKNDITGFNFRDRVKLFFKKGEKLEQVVINTSAPLSSSTGKVSTEFISDQWLNNSTPVEVYMEIDGMRTNTIILTVVDIPRLPPVIATLNPDKVTTGKGETLFFVRGQNLGEDRTTKVLINGIEAPLRNYSYIDEWIDVYLPQSIRETPGTYPVIVESIFGKSNTLYFTVEKSLLRMAPVQKTLAVNPNINSQEDLKAAQQKSDTTIAYKSQGIIIQMAGTIQSESNRTYLQEYIQELDEVKKINNNLQIGSINNVFIKIKGFKTAPVTLEHIKLSVEKKLKALGISGVVELN